MFSKKPEYMTHEEMTLQAQLERALKSLKAEEITIDVSKPPFLKLQIVAETFQGKNLVERLDWVFDLLEENLPEVWEQYSLRITVFTRDGLNAWKERVRDVKRSSND